MAAIGLLRHAGLLNTGLGATFRSDAPLNWRGDR